MSDSLLSYMEYQNLSAALTTVIERYGIEAVQEVVASLAIEQGRRPEIREKDDI